MKKTNRASDNLRQVIGNGPPYDTQKAMAWFTDKAQLLLIELEALEEEFDRHNMDIDDAGSIRRTFIN